MRTILAAWLIVLLIVAGCGYQPPPAPPASTTASQTPAPKPNPQGPPAPAPGQSGTTAGIQAASNAVGLAPLDMMDGGSPAPVKKAPPQPKPEGTYSKAETRRRRRGAGYGGGIITEPVHQYFRLRERINFLMMDKAMSDFKILKERLPKDQAEFDALMAEYGVKLPQLNPGEEYYYDPQAGELMVRHPQ